MSKLPWWAFRAGSWSDFLFPHCLTQLPNSTVETKLTLGQKYNPLSLTHSHPLPKYDQIEMPFEGKLTNTKEL